MIEYFTQDVLIYFCNLSTIGLCFIIKLPQLISIFKTKSTYGLSFNGILVEYLAHLVVFSYNWVEGYPIATYFEYALLLIQDLILIVFVFAANKNLDFLRVSALGLSIAVFYGFINGIPNPHILPFLIRSVIPIGASSKLMFINEIWRTRDASNVSITTWWISAYTCIARVITNYLKDDLPLMLHSIVSFILCTFMCISAIKFRTPNINKSHKKKEN